MNFDTWANFELKTLGEPEVDQLKEVINKLSQLPSGPIAEVAYNSRRSEQIADLLTRLGYKEDIFGYMPGVFMREADSLLQNEVVIAHPDVNWLPNLILWRNVYSQVIMIMSVGNMSDAMISSSPQLEELSNLTVTHVALHGLLDSPS